MPTDAIAQPPLNEVQITLLRLFSRKMTATETQAVQKILMEFYEKELQDEVEKIIQEKNIGRKDFDRRLNQQKRTK